MKNTLNINVTEDEASSLAAEINFINHQEELLNSRREILELRKVAFNRLAAGYAMAQGHKISNVLNVQLSAGGPNGERMLALSVVQPDPEPVPNGPPAAHPHKVVAPGASISQKP